MDIKEYIIERLNKKTKVSSRYLVRKTGFTRSYLNRFLQELIEEGQIVKIGKARKTIYILADAEKLESFRESRMNYSLCLKNDFQIPSTSLNTLESIKKETGIFSGLSVNVVEIIDSSFTELLNNAIVHSGAESINIKMKREQDFISTEITDNGIGIFKKIMEHFSLKNELEAIQQILRGKLTTFPESHAGQGLYNVSKSCDSFVIHSGRKKFMLNNIVNEMSIKDAREIKGTRIKFSINENRNVEKPD